MSIRHCRRWLPQGMLACLPALVLLATSASGENWARFRGPEGAGVSAEAGFPAQWPAEAYAWKTRLPGLGHSSPCVWNDHVFLTCANEDGTERVVIDINAADGSVRWSDGVRFKPYGKHDLNSYASATPATDGRRVYFLFSGDSEFLVMAYDFEGQRIWQRDLGPYYNQHGHGSGTSPIVFEDLVIVSNQQDGESFVVALDSATGDERWKFAGHTRLAGHSTPMVYRRDGADPRLLFTNTGDGLACLKPRTGELLWRADLFTSRCVGSPIVAGDLMFAICGGGGRGKFAAALPVDRQGELDQSAAAWTSDQNLPYVCTPVAVGEHLFLWGDNGVVRCLKTASGEEVWTGRAGGSYSGSPICVDGKLYCVSQDGEVVVMAAGPKFEVLGRSSLGEGCHSTPAVSNGRMFIRGFEHLFCLPAQRR